MGLQWLELLESVATFDCEVPLVIFIVFLVSYDCWLIADLAAEHLTSRAANAHTVHLAEVDGGGFPRLLQVNAALQLVMQVEIVYSRWVSRAAWRLLLDVEGGFGRLFAGTSVLLFILLVSCQLHVHVVVPHSDRPLHGHVQNILILTQNTHCLRGALWMLQLVIFLTQASVILNIDHFLKIHFYWNIVGSLKLNG